MIFKTVQGDCSCSLVAPGSFCNCDQHKRDWSHWIQVTAVCQRWREIALDDPSLWNTILIERASTRRVLRCLRLSRGAPLDIVISNYDHVPNVIQKELESRCAQLRQLHIKNAFDSTDQFVSLNMPAPLLQHLQLVSCNDGMSLLPMFANSTPRLQSLFVSGLRYRPQVTFSRVPHIHLSRQYNWTLDDLQGFLRANTSMNSRMFHHHGGRSANHSSGHPGPA